MSKNNPRTYLLTAFLLAAIMPALGQAWLDYDQALTNYPLLHTTNAAGLTTFTPRDSSQLLMGDARVGTSTGHGQLKHPGSSTHEWNAQACVRSIYRLSRRTVVRGSMDYCYNWRRLDGGSVWIDPERMPFDITETNDSTLGNSSLETYHLNGELGINVGRGFSLGAQFDYTTASGAKKKDPRHINSLMLCKAGAGALWQHGRLTLGANYLFERSTEALRFSTVGRTDQVYLYLIDNGAFFGREETTDGNGYVGSEYERPLLDISHGMAWQAQYRQGAWSAGIEGEWHHRHGHYGLESPAHLDFNRHNGDRWKLWSWWQHASGKTLQRLVLSLEHHQLKDYERTYRIITDQGVTDVNYYDDRLMGQSSTHTINVSGTAQWGLLRELAAWQLQAGLRHHRRTLTASLYPFYRQQQTHTTEATLQGERNWLLPNDQTWSTRLLMGWSGGSGIPHHDGTYQAPDGNNIPPQGHIEHLMREYEYLTSKQLHLGAGVRWAIPLNHDRMRLYADADYHYSQAFNIHYLDNGYRHRMTLSLGCLF